MRRRPRPIRMAIGGGLILLTAALATVAADRSYASDEVPAAPATLERIARKNDAAAMRAAEAMEARAAHQTNRQRHDS